MNRGKFLYSQEKLDGGWTIIHVLNGTTMVGRITRDPKSGRYRFFPGSDNNVSFDFEHADLQRLKEKIETSPARWNQ